MVFKIILREKSQKYSTITCVKVIISINPTALWRPLERTTSIMKTKQYNWQVKEKVVEKFKKIIMISSNIPSTVHCISTLKTAIDFRVYVLFAL